MSLRSNKRRGTEKDEGCTYQTTYFSSGGTELHLHVPVFVQEA